MTEKEIINKLFEIHEKAENFKGKTPDSEGIKKYKIIVKLLSKFEDDEYCVCVKSYPILNNEKVQIAYVDFKNLKTFTPMDLKILYHCANLSTEGGTLAIDHEKDEFRISFDCNVWEDEIQ